MSELSIQYFLVLFGSKLLFYAKKKKCQKTALWCCTFFYIDRAVEPPKHKNRALLAKSTKIGGDVD